MPTACLALIAGVLGLLTSPTFAQTSRPSDTHAADLLSTGSVSSTLDGIWAARVIRPSGSPAETRILFGRGTEPFQQVVSPLSGAAISIAPLGTQLAVLLDDGEWLLVSESGTTLAPVFDAGAGKLLTFASDAEGLYALARVGGEPAKSASLPSSNTAGTSPASQPTTQAATRPSTLPGRSSSIAYLSYRNGAWVKVAELPAEVARSIDAVSLTIQDKTPVVLVRDSLDTIRLWRLDGAEWSLIGQANIASTARSAQLIAGGPRPTALIVPASAVEADRVLVFDVQKPQKASSQPTTAPAIASSSEGRPPKIDVRLEATKGVAPAGRSAAYLPSSSFRSIVLSGEKLNHQTYDRSTLTPVGSAVSAEVQEAPSRIVEFIEYGIVLVAMIFAIVASYRRREQVRALNLEPEELPLAPLGVRMLAGLIDAAPLLIGFFYYLAVHRGQINSTFATTAADLIALSGFVIYMLHTTLVETFAGRSLGKMICGLRVVSVDGSVPTRKQLLTRNLLRVIDVLLQFFPLLLVAFSPLRQRAGDAAAGTLVVTTEPAPKPQTPEE